MILPRFVLTCVFDSYSATTETNTCLVFQLNMGVKSIDIKSGTYTLERERRLTCIKIKGKASKFTFRVSVIVVVGTITPRHPSSSSLQKNKR
jgi:hypothetical protein